jgi:hypothetical protein
MRISYFRTSLWKNLDLKKADKPRKFIWEFTTDQFYDFSEEFIHKLRRKNIYLKHNMMKLRIIRVPFTERRITYSFSNICGHGAFILLALSYLETEFLNLRLYATSGIFLSILFQ